MAEATEEKNLRMKEALGIKSEYKDGSSFDQELKAAHREAEKLAMIAREREMEKLEMEARAREKEKQKQKELEKR